MILTEHITNINHFTLSILICMLILAHHHHNLILILLGNKQIQILPNNQIQNQHIASTTEHNVHTIKGGFIVWEFCPMGWLYLSVCVDEWLDKLPFYFFLLFEGFLVGFTLQVNMNTNTILKTIIINFHSLAFLQLPSISLYSFFFFIIFLFLLLLLLEELWYREQMIK